MTHSLSPTTVLPVLAILHVCSATRVREALRALRNVYFSHARSSTVMGAVPALKQSLSGAVPALRPKRTVCLVHHDGVPDSGYASAEEDCQDEQEDGANEDAIDDKEMDEELDALHSDELECGYAIKWITGSVKRGDAWVCGDPDSSAFPSSEEQEARTKCLEDASRLLARFAGDDGPEEGLTRTFVFPFRMPPCRCCRCWDVSSPALPITVELNDAPVDGTDYTAVGLQSWGSAIVFAERMCSDPERYLGALYPCTSIPTTARQRGLLEFGAGTGLLSITAAQILSRTSVQATIKATDYHPSVLENLAQNVQYNHSAVGVSAEKLDWCAVPCIEGVGVHVDVDDDEDWGVWGVYDVVLAADVVYHPKHASWIRGCVEQMLKKDGVFWLIIPVRTIGRHAGLGKTVEEAFPALRGVCKCVGVGTGERERLGIVRSEEVERVDGVGYALFEIRWVADSWSLDTSMNLDVWPGSSPWTSQGVQALVQGFIWPWSCCVWWSRSRPAPSLLKIPSLPQTFRVRVRSRIPEGYTLIPAVPPLKHISFFISPLIRRLPTNMLVDNNQEYVKMKMHKISTTIFDKI